MIQQFGFFLTKEQKGAYLDGAVTLFGALTLGVYIKLGIGSIDFELVLQMMEDLSLKLKMHASVPVPALSLTDPQGSINALTSFDPSKASFSMSGSVNLNGLKRLLVNFVTECLPSLDGALEFAHAAFDEAKRVYEDLVQAGQEAYQQVLEVGQQALELFENIGEQLDNAVEQAEEALKAAEAAVDYAKEQAAEMVAQATKYAQEFIDNAKAALKQTEKYFDDAKAAAQKAITDAQKAVTDFLANQAKIAADAATNLYNSARSYLPWEVHPNPRIRAVYQRVRMQQTMAHFAQSRDEQTTLRPNGGQARALFAIWDDVGGALTGAAAEMKKQLEAAVSTITHREGRPRRLPKFETSVLLDCWCVCVCVFLLCFSCLGARSEEWFDRN